MAKTHSKSKIYLRNSLLKLLSVVAVVATLAASESALAQFNCLDRRGVPGPFSEYRGSYLSPADQPQVCACRVVRCPCVSLFTLPC